MALLEGEVEAKEGEDGGSQELEEDEGEDEGSEDFKEEPGSDPQVQLAKGVKEKDRGKEAYAKGDYEEAVEAWRRARGTFNNIIEQKLFKDDPAKLEEVEQLQLLINLNLAQGCLKNGQFHEAVSHANKVLEVEPRNEKALHRKAAALMDASSFNKARETLNILLEVDPSSALAKQMLNENARKAAASQKSAKRVSRKMMEGMERDPRTGLTWKEWGKKEASNLIERVLSIDVAALVASTPQVRSLRWCRRRCQRKSRD